MSGKFKMIGMAIFLLVFSGCGGGDSSSGGGTATTKHVTTIAGTAGLYGSADGTGAAARFHFPLDITSDGTNLYVTDSFNSTIRQIVIATGAVTTIAGTPGTPGYADGIGAAAGFNNPDGIATDGANLYVADLNNNTIRQIVIATGAVTTIAGAPPPAVGGTADGIGPAARFSLPARITITPDRTTLYVTDSGNDTIRKIVIATRAVSTIAGTPGVPGFANGTAGATFNNPAGITITPDGTSLYVADFGNSIIRQIVIATGMVSTIAGNPSVVAATNGFGIQATFNNPVGITTDGTNLYVADTYNSWIRNIVISTQLVTTLAGAALAQGSFDGSVAVALFYLPSGITAVGANLYVADTYNHTIREIF